jgi:diaminobutyrate-2-oxoglutarate transaminase
VLAYTAGAAALDFMVTTSLADHAFKLGERMLSSLKELEAASRVMGEVCGKGVMLGVEFVKDKATKEPWPEGARRVRSACPRRGLLIEIGGHYSQSRDSCCPWFLPRSSPLRA